ncbi:MAG: zinc ribbon domain-containing protein [Candidatus Lokiarchaeota archaeon]|nr:zinc ribbon domain-containing protein [Candidatus Lokiarchaeota archaeon]
MGNLELGKTLSYVGGALSLISGIFILFPLVGFSGIFGYIEEILDFRVFVAIFIVLFVMMITGGIITIIGAAQVEKVDPDKAGTTVIIGSVVAGVNWISLIGGILLKQAKATSGIFAGQSYRQAASSDQNRSPARYCKNCGKPLEENERYCRICGTESTQW